MALDPFGPSAGLDPAAQVAGLDPFAPDPNAPGPFRKGFGAGVAGVKASAAGAGALIARAVGAKDLEKAALDKAAAESEIAAAQNQGIEQVDWTSPSSVADQFKWLLGNAAPSLLTMAAGGVVGRGLGALAGRGASAAAKASALRTGTLGGAVVPDVALEAGSIFPEALETGVENPAVRAAVGGAAAGALDFIPLLAAERYLKAAGKGGFGAILKGAVKGAPIGGALEGAQETGQAIIERFAAGRSLTDSAAMSDFINSFAGGFAPGVVFGGAIGAHRGASAPALQSAAPITSDQPLVEPEAPLPSLEVQPAEPAFQGIGPQGSDPALAVSLPPVEGVNAPLDVALPLQMTGVEEPVVAQDPYNRTASPLAQDADLTMRDTLLQRASMATEQLSALDEEAKKPAKERRTDDEITAERTVTQGVLSAVTQELARVENSLEVRRILAETPQGPLSPRTGSPEPIIIGGKPETDTSAAEAAVAAVKRSLGVLVSSREAKLAPKLDPIAPDLVVPEGNTPKVSTTATVSEQTRQGAVQEAVVQSVAPNISALVKAKNLAPGGQAKLTRVLTDALNSVVKDAAALPSSAAAQAHILKEAPKVLKGRVLAQDADEIAQTMSRAVDQAHTLYSRGVVYRGGKPFGEGALTWFTPDKGAAKEYASLDAGGKVTKASIKGKKLAGVAEVRSIATAIGLEIPADQSAYSIFSEHQFAGAGQLLAAIKAAGYDGVRLPKGEDFAPSGKAIEAIGLFNQESRAALSQDEFDALPEPAKFAAVDEFNRIMRERGTALRQHIMQLVGNDPALVVKTFMATPNSPIGSYTRVGPLKSVVALALNAKQELSVADHEGYHYAEDRLLTYAERQIVANALKDGRPLYKALLGKVQAYDRENKTNLADEIASIPAERRAYAFEFWRRGELQPEGALNRVWAKIRTMLEKVRNFVTGLGFTSIEDVFTAFDRSQFAERTRNGVDQAQFGDVPPEMATYYSQAAVDMERRFQAGELPREQMMATVSDLIGQNLTPITGKQALGAVYEQTVGSLQRWRLKHVATGNYISRFSKGYANVQKTLLAYVQRKSSLIAQGSLEQLSSWHANATSQSDITAVGRVLLERTEKGMLAGSPEFNALVAGLTDHQRTMFKQATDMIAGRLQHELEVDKKTMAGILPAADYEQWLTARQTQVEKLIAEGYVPERRYGDYTVHIFLPNSDPSKPPLTLHYEQYENQAAADVQAQRYKELLAKEAPELRVEAGYKYKVERDASISIQQFMDTARRNGVNLTQAERERLAKALVQADSTRRNRLFHRKNIPGYSEDIMRVLHEFVVTTAGKVAYAEFATPINDALDGKPVDARTENGVPMSTTDSKRNLWKEDGPQSGFYRNLTDELSDYVLVPDHSGNWSRKLRGAAMTYFIGGSIASGAVNLMSIPMNVAPWLSQSTSYTNAVAKTGAAISLIAKNFAAVRDLPTLKNPDVPLPAIDAIPGLRQALITAAEDGRTLDTEIHQIMGMAQGASYAHSRKVQKAMEVWMAPFKMTEQFNRLVAFTAAYRVGQENKLTGRDLYDFAAGTVDNTQNRYDEVNRPGLARHPIGAILFMFRSFPLFMVEMVETMYRQNPKSAVYMLLGLTAMTGVQGLPFAETIENLIDTIAQKIFGSPFNSRRAMRNLIKDASEALVGADLSEVVLRGMINEMTGMAMSSRIGMGDFIPGTRIGAADSDYGRTASEILGAPIAMVTGVASATGKVLKGDFLDALRAGGPVAVRNIIKGGEQLDRGYGQDAKGRKLVDVTGPEAFWQSLGFSSAALNKAYEMDKIDKQRDAFYTQVRSDFGNQLVRALKDGDAAKAQETFEAVQAWNRAYPEMPLMLSPASIRRDIVMAGLPLNARTLMLMPRALRGSSVAAGIE